MLNLSYNLEWTPCQEGKGEQMKKFDLREKNAKTALQNLQGGCCEKKLSLGKLRRTACSFEAVLQSSER